MCALRPNVCPYSHHYDLTTVQGHCDTHTVHTDRSVCMSHTHLSLASVSVAHRLFTAVASALLHTQLKSCLDALV